MDAEREHTQRIKQSQEIFESKRAKLQELFPHEFIAMIDGIVVEHDLDLNTLTRCTYANYDIRPIFIENVDAPKIISVPTVFAC